MLLSNLFTSAILLASTAVNALPNPMPAVGGEGIYNNVLVARVIPEEFRTHAIAAIAAFGPRKNETMFHSGIGSAKAFEVAKAKSLQTVETTLSLALMDDKKSKKNVYKDTLQKYCVEKPEYLAAKVGDLADWMAAWETVSQEWANFAETETTLATSKKGPNEKSFYKRIEEPVLIKHGIKINVNIQE